MSYRAITEMTTSPSLIDRIAACIAATTPDHGATDPRSQAQVNAWRFAATPGWAAAWQKAVDDYHVNFNPDLGARTDVISDEMIEAAVGQFFGGEKRVGDDGALTTRAADPTLSPEEGGPDFEVVPQPAGLDDMRFASGVQHPRA